MKLFHIFSILDHIYLIVPEKKIITVLTAWNGIEGSSLPLPRLSVLNWGRAWERWGWEKHRCLLRTWKWRSCCDKFWAITEMDSSPVNDLVPRSVRASPRIQIILRHQWNTLQSHFCMCWHPAESQWHQGKSWSTGQDQMQSIVVGRWSREWMTVLPLRITGLIFKYKRKKSESKREKEQTLNVKEPSITHLIQSSTYRRISIKPKQLITKLCSSDITTVENIISTSQFKKWKNKQKRFIGNSGPTSKAIYKGKILSFQILKCKD